MSVSFLRIPTIAAYVTLATPEDPAQFVSNMFDRMSTLIADGSDLDGWAVRVVDMAGRPILSTAHSLRLVASETWVRPDLVGDYPLGAAG